jgi:hypothetical protein
MKSVNPVFLQQFYYRTREYSYVRRYLLFGLLCVVFFIFPLQVFIIGDYTGIGIQGAVYRYQVSGYGTNFFPITREFDFVLNGTYSGRTALSILLWVSGTVLLACTTIFSVLRIDDTRIKYYHQIMYGLIAPCVIFLGSCIAQYGFMFHGPAGIALPVGIIVILCWIVGIYFFRNSSDRAVEAT